MNFTLRLQAIQMLEERFPADLISTGRSIYFGRWA